MKKIFYLLLILFSAINLYANDRDDIFTAMKTKYGNLNSISFDFISTANKNIFGKIVAAKGNKYQLIFQDRVIVCDGKTVWNYSNENKNCMISNLESLSKDVSIEKFFFNFINNTEPITLQKYNESKGTSALLLQIKDKKTKREVGILLDPNSLMIMRIALDNDEQNTWDVKNLRINPKIQDSIFEFKIPKDAEVIDLR